MEPSVCSVFNLSAGMLGTHHFFLSITFPVNSYGLMVSDEKIASKSFAGSDYFCSVPASSFS